MDLRQLRSFVAVARHGNVTRAAQEEYLTQSALSQQLRRLEDELGLRLLTRTSRGVELTPAGTDLLRHAEAVLAEVARAHATLAEHAGHQRGVARIAATAADAARLPAALASFHREHPGVRVALRNAPGGELPGLLRRGAADLALAPADADTAGLEATPLPPEPLHVIAAPGDAPPSTAGGLRGTTLILPEPGSALRAAVVAACESAGFGPVPLFEVSDPGAVRALVGAGLGVSVAPQSWLAQPGAEVSAVPLEGHALALVLLRPAVEPSPAAALLDEHLRAALA